MEPPCEGWYVERPDYFASVAFWYQTGQPSPWGPLPSYADRQLPWTTIKLVDSLPEARASGGDLTVQWLSDRPIIFWQNTDPAGCIEVPFTVPSALRCAAKLSVVTSYDYGTFDVCLDGEKLIDSADLYRSDTGFHELSFGTREIAAGPHVLKLTCRGASERSGPADGAGHYLGLDAVKLLELPEYVMRPMGRRGREERHWIWRAITDGVRASRATHRRTPESLQAMVDAGLLGDRYLNDENHQPLESWLEGDKLVVESVGMDGIKGTDDDWHKEW